MNNNTMSNLAVCLTLVLLAVSASAQTSDVKPPQDPPISKLPAKIQWIKSAEPAPSKSDSASKQLGLLTMTTIKSDGLRKTTSVFANGEQVDVWFENNMFLIDRPEAQARKYKVFDVDPEFPSIPIPSDLSELKWIRVSNYVKAVDYEKRKAWFFESSETLPVNAEANPADPPPVPVKLQAWVDPETQLPMAFHDGTKTWRYKFSPYEGTLTLPPALLAEVRSFRERVAADAKLRARVP
jgi:hypothetical protein